MQKHILVVDDNSTNLRLAEKALRPLYKVTLLISGEQALKFLAKTKPDLILLDIRMPGIDGFQTIKAIKSNVDTKHIPVIFLTAQAESESEILGLQLGAADFIAKPFVPEVMLRRVAMQIELNTYRNKLELAVSEQTEMVERLQDVIVMSITELVEFRDKITGGHARRTAEYLKLLVEKLAGDFRYEDILTSSLIDDMLRAAPLHDVGKIGINDNILTKTSFLDDTEFEFMKQHTILGGIAFEKCINQIPDNTFLHVARDMALYHHERWDGSGYPYGLSGSDIPFTARCMAIADVYDALTTKRSYKEPFSHEKALQIMTNLKGTHFDPDLIDVFTEYSDDFSAICESFKGE